MRDFGRVAPVFRGDAAPQDMDEGLHGAVVELPFVHAHSFEHGEGVGGSDEVEDHRTGVWAVDVAAAVLPALG